MFVCKRFIYKISWQVPSADEVEVWSNAGQLERDLLADAELRGIGGQINGRAIRGSQDVHHREALCDAVGVEVGVGAGESILVGHIERGRPHSPNTVGRRELRGQPAAGVRVGPRPAHRPPLGNHRRRRIIGRVAEVRQPRW